LGSYDSIDNGERFQVKQITVKLCANLSVQRHYQVAEHCVAVLGIAKVTEDHKEILLTENQSTYMPQKTHGK
jgi:mannose-6-phosphate isomerase-like protein (cupin superfamily)